MSTPARTLVNFYMDNWLLVGLKQVKADVGISESEQVRRAVAAWLAQKGIRPPGATKTTTTRKKT